MLPDQFHQVDGLLLLVLVIPISFAIAVHCAQWCAALLFGRNTLPRKRATWEKVPDFHLHDPVVYVEPSPISPAARRFRGRVGLGVASRTASLT
ncbi:MAG: hypothetical protein ACYCW6_29175 [Candidatus Xenobia bacterium]